MSAETEDSAWLTAARPSVPATLAVRLLATVRTLPVQAPAPWRRRVATGMALVAVAAALVLAVLWSRHPAVTLRQTTPLMNEPASTVVVPVAPPGPSNLSVPTAGVVADPSPQEIARHQAVGVPLTGFHVRVACTGCHKSSSPPTFQKVPSTCVGCHPTPHDKRFTEKQCTSCHVVTRQP